ncbi:hypothetical protein PISMIDRAFT_25568 [Pisolithus microcarpus 441]|uniref:Uncharacterized protein n=1 Tax=Pisolithus microcarpus 441 TaxID=765257 RepID=A0A0C9YSL4_9AGAM|nr:hypothetical protein BKA83DRAFT_25568 [Pisolithus microcarpus]KIK13302.1 hypothetical protein PISMIDRAFT_25568 [Pisolithus microcarpus 441]
MYYGLRHLLNASQQLHQWFHWHAGAGKNRVINHKTYQLVDKLLKLKAHVNKDWEIYAKVYYHSWVKLKIEGSMTMNISTLCQKIKDAFESESQEIQDEIFHMKEEQVVAASTSRDSGKEGIIGDEDDSIIDPKIHQLNIEQCRPALQHILEYMVTKTGWAFSIIMGGPDPLDAQGECIVTSLHVGENKLRYNFAQAYSRFDGEVMPTYTEFLDHMFRRVYEVSNPPQSKSESNNGEGGCDLEGDEDDEDHPSNAAMDTYTLPMVAIATPSTGIAMSLASIATPLADGMLSNVATSSPAHDSVPAPVAMPANVTHITTYNPTSTCVAAPTSPMGAIAMPSTGVAMSLVSVATPLVDGMLSHIATCLSTCDSVPMPVAMPANATHVTTCNPTSTCVTTPTGAGQFHNPTLLYVTVPILGSTARQSGDLVQAYTPTQSAVDLLLASGVPSLVAGLPMTYGNASHPIWSISNFDLSAMMVFDFPPLSIFEMDIGAMMYGDTSLTTMGGPVQWSSGPVVVPTVRYQH